MLFDYSLQLDEEEMVTNIFWLDARMMIDYEVFGDVVSLRSQQNPWWRYVPPAILLVTVFASLWRAAFESASCATR